jgi:hypothetical protein
MAPGVLTGNAGVLTGNAFLYGEAAVAFAGHSGVAAEPPLAAYARHYG